jgi:hypothetical protein
MREDSGLKKLFFKLQNLCDFYDIEEMLDFVNEEDILEQISFLCYRVLNSSNYTLDIKTKNKCFKLLETEAPHDLSHRDVNKVILAANLILKLNLENQKLS